MRPGKLLTVVAVLGLGAAVVAGCSSGSSSKSSKKSGGGGGGVTVSSGATGTPVAVDAGDTQGLNGPMTMTVAPPSVAAGKVTFTVKNSGTIDHEAVVLKTDTAFDQLPITGFQGEPNRVDEASKVGESGDPPLKPGETRSFTVDLTAGKYAVVCNIAGHYKMGMRAAFTVA
jgi:uncharacterized cupredoxin-like copper-binding protein